MKKTLSFQKMYTFGVLATIIKQVDFFHNNMLFFTNAPKMVVIIVIFFSKSFMRNKHLINIFSKRLYNRHSQKNNFSNLNEIFGDLDPF